MNYYVGQRLQLVPPYSFHTPWNDNTYTEKDNAISETGIVEFDEFNKGFWWKPDHTIDLFKNTRLRCDSPRFNFIEIPEEDNGPT